jgi:hypothetical protein
LGDRPARGGAIPGALTGAIGQLRAHHLHGRVTL